MEQPVTLVASLPMRSLRVAMARVRQRLGLPGLLGGALLLASAALLGSAWRSHQSAQLEALSAASAMSVAPADAIAAAISTPSRVLPGASELPRLLSRIERAANVSGLGWPRAEYRVNAATDDLPASVDVRCTLSGSYPQIRQFVTALLQDTPTLTLREFTLSRNTPDLAEVEAKLAIIVYLAGDTAQAGVKRP
jgi:Pilus assembly protein, PilO